MRDSSPAVLALLLLILLAAAGALRWDVLMLRLREWFQPPPAADQHPPASMRPVPLPRPAPHAPRRLHDSELHHQAQHRAPGFHRSGRRG